MTRSYTVSDAQETQIKNAFVYHAPKDDQPDRYVEIRELAREFATRLCQLAPPSRELSLALTNLEQAVFWGNASIARNE